MRRQIGVEENDRIEEWVLSGAPDRRRLIQRGYGHDHARPPKLPDCPSKMSGPGPEVGAEADGEPGHRDRSTVTATSSNFSGIGASGLWTVTTTRSTSGRVRTIRAIRSATDSIKS